MKGPKRSISVSAKTFRLIKVAAEVANKSMAQVIDEMVIKAVEEEVRDAGN